MCTGLIWVWAVPSHSGLSVLHVEPFPVTVACPQATDACGVACSRLLGLMTWLMIVKRKSPPSQCRDVSAESVGYVKFDHCCAADS